MRHFNKSLSEDKIPSERGIRGVTYQGEAKQYFFIVSLHFKKIFCQTLFQNCHYHHFSSAVKTALCTCSIYQEKFTVLITRPLTADRN